MPKILLLCGLCLSFLSTVLMTTGTRADTLTEVYQLSLENDPQLRAARAAYQAGLESENIGRAGLLPQIRATGTYNDSEADGTSTNVFGQSVIFGRDGETDTDSQEYSLTLSQPLFDLPAWFQFQQGKALSQQAEAQFSADQQALIIRVTSAYFNVLRASENLATARAEETAIGRQLEQTRERFQVGLLPITDVHEAQAAYDNAAVNALEAEGALGIAFEALEVLTGQSHNQLAGLAADFPVKKPEPLAREDWVTFALANNLDLKVAGFARDAAGQNASSRKMEHLPTLTGSLAYNNNDSDSDFSGTDLNTGQPFSSPSTLDQETQSVALRLEVPLFTGGLVSAQRRQAYQQYLQAQENFTAAQRNTIQQARSQHLSVLTNAARVKARNQAVTSAESALEATQAGYDVGTRNIVDVLVAQRSLYEARRNYANARYDYVDSMLELKRVAGQLSPDDIFQLNAWLDPNLAVSKTGQ